MIFFILLFGVHQLFCYVVCEYLHNVDEAARLLASLLLQASLFSMGSYFFLQIFDLKGCQVFLSTFIFQMNLNRDNSDTFLSPGSIYQSVTGG